MKVYTKICLLKNYIYLIYNNPSLQIIKKAKKLLRNDGKKMRRIEEIFENTKWYQIRWIVNAMQVVSDETKIIVNYGICEKTKRICFQYPEFGGMDNMAPLVIHDTYVDVENNRCESGRYCLCLDCEYNDTCYSSYIEANKTRKDYLIRKTDFDKLLKEIKTIEGYLEKEISKLDFDEINSIIFKSPIITKEIK